MKSRTDPRHAARKLALSSLFCWLYTEPHQEQCDLLAKELLKIEDSDQDPKLTRFIEDGVKHNIKKIDEIIAESAPEWPIDKISKVDLIILRISVFEMVFGRKTPVKVAIDEAVELAKEFGNDTSHKFVNGVLGTVVNKHVSQNKVDTNSTESE